MKKRGWHDIKCYIAELANSFGLRAGYTLWFSQLDPEDHSLWFHSSSKPDGRVDLLIYWRVNEEVASKIDTKLLVLKKRNIGISLAKSQRLVVWIPGSLVGVHQCTTMNCKHPKFGFSGFPLSLSFVAIYIYSSTWYFSILNNIMIPMGCFLPSSPLVSRYKRHIWDDFGVHLNTNPFFLL